METELIQALNNDLRGQNWRLEAACREMDPELFFGANANTARVICASCPVRRECHEYAVRTDQPYGVFGGVGSRGRRKGRTGHAQTHGTRRAYRWHRKHGEYPCQACVDWLRAEKAHERKAS